jgi:hypothetical protein
MTYYWIVKDAKKMPIVDSFMKECKQKKNENEMNHIITKQLDK